MDGPKVVIRLNSAGNVVYGCERGCKLIKINDTTLYKDQLWFLVLWEGYDMAEAVPATIMNRYYPREVVEYHMAKQQELDNDKPLPT